jgi:hypothetical protein
MRGSECSPLDDGFGCCERCGEQRLLDEEGYCVFCRQRELGEAVLQACGVLEVLEAAVRAASSNAHADDIRGCVEHALVTADGRQPLTLAEIHERLRELHEQGVH